MCSEYLKVTWYVKRRVKAKKSVDVATKALRQMPSSHCPWKYLSPNSKSKHSRNVCQHQTRLQKQVLKFDKKTKVELPASQLSELCKLVKAIESSEEGKRQLDQIRKKGQQIGSTKWVSSWGMSVKCGSRTERTFLKMRKTTVRIAHVLVYIFQFRLTELTIRQMHHVSNVHTT